MSVYAGAAAYAGGGGYIEFDWVPEPEEVAQRLFQAADMLEDRSEPLLYSKQIAQADVRERFDTKTSPEGATWAPWSKSYEPDALANNVGGILERTGATRAAATSDAAYLITYDSVFFNLGGIPQQGIWNNFGASRGAGIPGWAEFKARAESMGMEVEGSGGGNVLPARPFIGISDKAQQAIIQVFDQWFSGIIAFAAGGSGGLRRYHSFRDPLGRFAKVPM